MDIDSQHLGIPESEHDCTVQMSSAEFKRIITDLSPLSENVTIDVAKGSVTFSAEGDLGSGSITVKSGSGSIDEDDEDCGTIITMNQATSVVLSLKYLQNFTKATSLSNQVTLGLSSSVPILCEFKVENIGYIK
jgi:proliferating cell nuclear antigen